MKSGPGPAPHIEGYYNTKELSKALDCHPMTLSRYTSQKDIPQPDLIKGRNYYWSIGLLPIIKANLGIEG